MNLDLIKLPEKHELRKNRRRVGYRRRWRRVPEHVVAAVAESIAAGRSALEVASVNKIGVSTVYKILKDAKP